MAKFGTFVYGDGTLYGESAATGLLSWAVEIDWNRDLIFDGTNEATRMFDIVVNRGRKTMLKSAGSGFQTIPPGTCTIKLRNNDGRYDAWNQGSPLYPYVKYGPDARIRIADQTDGVLKDIFYGTIVDIRPFGYGGDAYVEIKIEDTSRFMRKYRARTAILSNQTPDQAINAILNDIAWPMRWNRDIDASSGSINYYWSSGSKQAWAECEEIANSFLGAFFVAADGKATYRDKDAIPSLTLDLSQEVLLKDIYLPQPYVNQRNVVRLKVHPRKPAASGIVYAIKGDPLRIEAGRTKTIWANYTYNNKPVPVQNIVSPVGGTDYKAYSNSDGTGVDLTGDVTMTITDFGDNAKVVFANNGASILYVTERQIRADAIYEEDVDDVTYPDDPNTVEDPSEFKLDLVWNQSVNTAEDYALILGPFLGAFHAFPVVKLQGRPSIQFNGDLFDVVNLDLEELGIVGESFRIGGIEHRSIGPTCQEIETKLYLEPYLGTGDAWTWPTELGVTSIFGAG